jgi:hypothetical protein
VIPLSRTKKSVDRQDKNEIEKTTRVNLLRVQKRAEAVTLATFGLVSLIGTTLGFRFNVMVLFPAIGLASLYVACIEVGRGDGGGQIILTMILTALALQIGYLIAIALRSIGGILVDICRSRILAQSR